MHGLFQVSGKVNVNFFGDLNLNLNGNSILNVSKILGMNGKWRIDENGKLVVEEIETQKLKVENGVTTRDRTTGAYYCIFVDNGVLKSETGECGLVSYPEVGLPEGGPTSPDSVTPPAPGSEPAPSADTAPSNSTAGTEAPSPIQPPDEVAASSTPTADAAADPAATPTSTEGVAAN